LRRCRNRIEKAECGHRGRLQLGGSPGRCAIGGASVEGVASDRVDFGDRACAARDRLRAGTGSAAERARPGHFYRACDQPARGARTSSGAIHAPSADQCFRDQARAAAAGDRTPGRRPAPVDVTRTTGTSTGTTGPCPRCAQCGRGTCGPAEPGEPDVGHRSRPQCPSGHPSRRNPGSRARIVRDAAQRRGQSQPVLLAGLQPRPRHRYRDHRRRHAHQHAHPCSWPGLCGLELPDAGGDQFARYPKGSLFCRRGRFRQCRRTEYQPEGHRPTAHRRTDHREFRLREAVRDRLDQGRRRQPARCRRGGPLQRPVGQSRQHQEVRRGDALQPGHRYRRLLRHRHGLFQQMEFHRPGAVPGDRVGGDPALWRTRPQRRRRHHPFLAVGAGGAERRRRFVESQWLRDQIHARPLQ
jgi:hypothetical protein